EAAEHEAAVARHARHPAQAQGAFVAALEAIGEGLADQVAITAEGPRVVRAGEGARPSLLGGADAVAAVAATIQQQVDLTVAITGHDHLLRADGLQYEIVGLRHFTLMPDIDPGAIPD